MRTNIELDQFVRVDFKRFKAFRVFSIHLKHFNILVGPNNAGKSTVLAAFRILAAGMRRAHQKKAVWVPGPNGSVYGHVLEMTAASVAEENIFYNYDDSTPASVTFTLSNRNTLQLYFPEPGTGYLIPNDSKGGQTQTPSIFRSRFRCPIGFVPILGPVDHNERLFAKEAARQALYNYQAARNFRNIWYHYPERFETFRNLLQQTWPGMDVEPPKVDTSHEKPRLHMFCPEERIPREIFWAGFGFQVWCQMLTHVVQSKDVSLFLIDEPDIYLHSDLQRQLLGILKNLGPDVLLATHSTEIVTEADADDIVLVDKQRTTAKRIRNPAELGDVFRALGSNLNPILTQLAKTKRAVFVEGKDFQIIGRFAQRLRSSDVANRSEFAVVPVEGFNPERVRSLKRGIETTLGGPIAAAAILDRDYRSRAELSEIRKQCEEFCDVVLIHDCKEVENLLLVPNALDRAARQRAADRERRTGMTVVYTEQAQVILEAFAAQQKSYVVSQHLAFRRRFERAQSSSREEAQANQEALEEIEAEWSRPERRLELVPGKEALSAFNRAIQEKCGVSITPAAVIESMHVDEIPKAVLELLQALERFTAHAK